MNRVAQTYWVDQRLNAQRPLRKISASFGEIAEAAASPRTRARHFPFVSPHAIFLMVILTMSALCVTATMRAHAEVNDATLHHEKVSADVEALRHTNAALETEVRRLRTDPRAIESAARSRLGMLRPNEIVLTVE